MKIARLLLVQKKAILIHAAVVAVLLLFWLFIYLPRRNAAVKIKAELASLNSQIQAIEGMFDNAKTLDEGLNKLKIRYREVDRFPAQEEESIRRISEYARRLNIGILSLQTQPRTPLFGIDRQASGAKESTFQSIDVGLQLRSSYTALVRYVQVLKKSLPAFVTIERLEISKDKTGDEHLNCDMVLKLYLLSEK